MHFRPWELARGGLGLGLSRLLNTETAPDLDLALEEEAYQTAGTQPAKSRGKSAAAKGVPKAKKLATKTSVWGEEMWGGGGIGSAGGAGAGKRKGQTGGDRAGGKHKVVQSSLGGGEGAVTTGEGERGRVLRELEAQVAACLGFEGVWHILTAASGRCFLLSSPWQVAEASMQCRAMAEERARCIKALGGFMGL